MISYFVCRDFYKFLVVAVLSQLWSYLVMSFKGEHFPLAGASFVSHGLMGYTFIYFCQSIFLFPLCFLLLTHELFRYKLINSKHLGYSSGYLFVFDY